MTDPGGVGAAAISQANDEVSLAARERVYEANRELLFAQFRLDL